MRSLVCIAVLAAASTVTASTIEGKYTGLALGNQTHTVTVKGSVISGNVYAGPLNHFFQGAGSMFHNQTIATFCTELTQSVKTSFVPYELIALELAPRPYVGGNHGMGQAKADAIRLLWAGVGSSAFTDGLTAAGFQIAIWEIVYDFDGSSRSSFDVNTGNVRFENAKINGVNSAAIAKASELFNLFVWESGAPGMRNGAMEHGLAVMSSEQGQDQIVVIPLPAQGLMAGVGLLGLAARRRRRI